MQGLCRTTCCAAPVLATWSDASLWYEVSCSCCRREVGVSTIEWLNLIDNNSCYLKWG